MRIIHTNLKIKGLKKIDGVGRVVFKTTREMAREISEKLRREILFFDTETVPKSFDDQRERSKLIFKHEASGKKTTQAVMEKINKQVEDLRSDSCLDAKLSKPRICQIMARDDLFVVDMLEPGAELISKAMTGRLVCGQNLKFDIKVMRESYPLFRPSETYCTMVGHRIVRTADTIGWFNSKMEDLALYYLGVEMKKGHGADDWRRPVTEEQLKYACEDVLHLPEIMRKQIDIIEGRSVRKNGKPYFSGLVTDMVMTMEMRFVDVLADVELAGIPLNEEKLREREKAHLKELNKKKAYFDKLEVNTQSPLQISKWLDNQGVDTISTAQDELAKHAKNPKIADLLVVKKLQKETQMIHDYVSKWMRADKRMYGSFNQVRAATGRMSSYEPNFQQIPRPVKKLIYKSTKERPVFRGDYPSIEARVCAKITRDETIIKIFRDGRDMHKVTASAFLEKKEDRVTKEERDLAKPANFGFMFGMGALKFVTYAFSNYGRVFTIDEAEHQRRSYLNLYRGVKAYHQRNSDRLKESREILLRTALGRLMLCDSWTNANNYPIQGTAVEILKLASVVFSGRCRKEKIDSRIINVVHDEIVCDSSARDKKRAMRILKESMETAADFVIELFHTEVEIEEVE